MTTAISRVPSSSLQYHDFQPDFLRSLSSNSNNHTSIIGQGLLASDGASFDLATIHPSHGIHPITGSYMDSSSDGEGMSEAQKIMAAMAACGTEDNDQEEEEDEYATHFGGPEEGNDLDSSGSCSESDLDTPLNRTPGEMMMSFKQHESSDHSGSNNGKSPSLYSGSGKLSHSSGSLTPSINLERVSSCYFELPPMEHHTENGIPFDTALVRQLSSMPCTPAVMPYDSNTILAATAVSSAVSTTSLAPPHVHPAATLPSFNAISYSLAPSLSSSSNMMRSYSAPAPTQAQWSALQQRWNAEAQEAADALAAVQSTQGGEASTSSAASTSTTITPTTSPRPKIARRNTSAHIPTLRRQRDAEDSGNSEYGTVGTAAAGAGSGTGYQETFSSRNHLLNPANKHNPFKRSRLSFTAIAEDPMRESRNYASPSPPPSSTSFAERAASPPKSPTRPGLNRSFTNPEFYAEEEF